MSFVPGNPVREYPSERPPLQRSRSHTTPSKVNPIVDKEQQPVVQPLGKRPGHVRSHSHFSPTDTKPRNAVTLPTESSTGEKEKERDRHSHSHTHRLHLPGSGKHQPERPPPHRRHRYTQSEVHQYHGHRTKKHSQDNSSLSHLVAGLNAERDKRNAAGSFSANDHLHNAVPGGLTRMISTRSHRGGTNIGDAAHAYFGETGRFDLRRRATSDPKSPLVTLKSPVEQELERADRMRRTKRLNVTKQDVAKRDRDVTEARDELREGLDGITRSGMEITRRLDYGYYNLLEKVGNLVNTIQSFNSLSEQSAQMMDNFESETGKVDEDIKRRIGIFRRGFEARHSRVNSLEERGHKVGEKAADLGRRLENARVIVLNWEKREDQARKVWSRFWGGVWWSFVAIVVVVVAVVIGKDWWFGGDPVKAGLNVPWPGSSNSSLALGDGGVGDAQLLQANIPDEVRGVLAGIEERNRRGKKSAIPVLTEPTGDSVSQDGVESEHEQEQEDARLRVLDDL